MKRKIVALILVMTFLLTLLCACGGATSAEGAVKAYYNAINTKNAKGMASCYYDGEESEMQEEIDDWYAWFEYSGGELKKIEVTKCTLGKITEDDSGLYNADAIVYCSVEYEYTYVIDGEKETDTSEDEFFVIRVNGRWYLWNYGTIESTGKKSD